MAAIAATASPEGGQTPPAAPTASHDLETPSKPTSVPMPLSYTPKEESHLVRKIDLLLLPPLSLLYLLSFLDRSNIANARVDGLTADLHLSSSQYSTALTLFFVGYVLAELPANWGLKATSPPFWMPLLAGLFGVISLTQGLVHDSEGLLAVRFFLGVAEAGLFPGTVFIFSQWYLRRERVVRVSFFFSAAAAAGAFGGVLAYGINFMDGVGGKRGWQWIFILEGLLTILISFICFFIIPTWPTKTKWFTPRELAILHDRLSRDSDALELEGRFNWSGVRQALTDPKVYLYCTLFHGMSFALYTISLFLPSIIQGLGYKSWQAQLLTTPPYVLAFIVTMATAFTAKRVAMRAPFIIGGFCLAGLGYIVLLTSPTIGGKYVATFLIVCGVYAGNALLLAWPSENVAGATKRNTALAMQISIGNVGAIIGTQLYRQPLGKLRNANYHVSIGLTFIWLAIGVASASALWVIMARENRRRAAIREGAGVETNGAGDVPPADSSRSSTSGVVSQADEKGRVTVTFLDDAHRSREDIAKEWAELGDARVAHVYQC